MFVNTNYVGIFKGHFEEFFYVEFIDELLIYIFENHKDYCEQIFRFIETEHSSYIINNFNLCLNYYRNNLEILKKILENTYSETSLKTSWFAIFLIKNSNKPPLVREILKEQAINLINDFFSNNKTINKEKYIYVVSELKTIKKLIKRYKLGEEQKVLKEFETNLKNVHKEYIKMYRDKYVKEVDFSKEINKIKPLIKINEITKINFSVYLTHEVKDANKVVPRIVNINIKKRDALEGILFPNKNEWEIFHLIPNADRIVTIYYQILFFLLRDDDIAEILTSSMASALHHVSNDLELEDATLTKLFSCLIIDIKEILTNLNNSDFSKYNYLNTIRFICTFFEKILRELYVFLNNNDQYISEDNLYISNLLFDHNIKKVLGPDLTFIFLYYFSTTEKGDKIKGLYYRNRFIHFDNIDYEYEFTNRMVFKLYYLLLVLINQIDMYFDEKKPIVNG